MKATKKKRKEKCQYSTLRLSQKASTQYHVTQQKHVLEEKGIFPPRAAPPWKSESVAVWVILTSTSSNLAWKIHLGAIFNPARRSVRSIQFKDAVNWIKCAKMSQQSWLLSSGEQKCHCPCSTSHKVSKEIWKRRPRVCFATTWRASAITR